MTIRFITSSGEKLEHYKPMRVKSYKAYISKECNYKCLALKRFNKDKCHGKTIRGIRTSGDFEQICYFTDNSSYLR